MDTISRKLGCHPSLLAVLFRLDQHPYGSEENQTQLSDLLQHDDLNTIIQRYVSPTYVFRPTFYIPRGLKWKQIENPVGHLIYDEKLAKELLHRLVFTEHDLESFNIDFLDDVCIMWNKSCFTLDDEMKRDLEGEWNKLLKDLATSDFAWAKHRPLAPLNTNAPAIALKKETVVRCRDGCDPGHVPKFLTTNVYRYKCTDDLCERIDGNTLRKVWLNLHHPILGACDEFIRKATQDLIDARESGSLNELDPEWYSAYVRVMMKDEPLYDELRSTFKFDVFSTCIDYVHHKMSRYCHVATVDRKRYCKECLEMAIVSGFFNYKRLEFWLSSTSRLIRTKE